MAVIDHTSIVFKNGEWMKDTYRFDEDGNYINLCPFEYGRDGDIHTVGGIDIRDSIMWYRDEYDAVYERAGICRIHRWNFRSIVERIKWMLRLKRFVCYEQEVGVWKSGSNEIYIYHEPMKQSYVSFYTDGTDTYIVLGGYGHYNNVYAHFMSRGYGYEFEEKLAQEAFEWCCDSVLEHITDSIYIGDFFSSAVASKKLRSVFAKAGSSDGDEDGRV